MNENVGLVIFYSSWGLLGTIFFQLFIGSISYGNQRELIEKIKI